MTLSDPLGDMLTRIRNAQMRNRPKVSTPASKLRARVLDVLREEGYIRGYAEIEYGGGKTEFEIELKYYDGVSRHSRYQARFDAGPPRLFERAGSCRRSPMVLASPFCPRRKA